MKHEYAEAAGRRIKLHDDMLNDLPPIAQVEFEDVMASIGRGARGGMGERMVALMFFCVFTWTLPAADRVTVRDVEANRFSTEDVKAMVLAGMRIIERLFPPNEETDDDDDDEGGGGGNASPPATE